jgi:CHAT domain-containing protein/tetratricopeptide (TPR) repeat protein
MSNDRAVQECMQNWANRQYAVCYRQLESWLATNPTHELMQLALLCLQRLGQAQKVEQFGPQFLRLTAARPWHHLLLQLTLGQVDPARVLAQATTEEERCQTHYYAGARLVTEWRLQAAQAEFAACLAMASPCLERELAHAEIGAAKPTDKRAATADVEKQIDKLNAQVFQLLQQGRHEQAYGQATKACDLAGRRRGESHPLYAVCVNNLAQALQLRGDLAAAEPLFRQARDLRRAAGEENPSYVISVDNLAALYLAKGDYAAAEPLFQEALLLGRRAWGENHVEYAHILNNLACLYRETSRFAAAEPLLKQALEIVGGRRSENDPRYASTLDNLARVYQAMGNYAAAEPLFRQGLALRRAVLGEHHPDYACSLSNLATYYFTLGDYAAAELLFQEAVEVSRKYSGPNHPHHATALNNLALVYQAQRKHTASEALLSQALAICRASLGENHPDYARSLTNLGGAYQFLGRHVAAEPLYRQALEILRVVVGKDHRNYAVSLNNLALLYAGMGHYAAAEPLVREALEILRAVLGEDHQEVAACWFNLAGLCVAMGRPRDAMPLMQRVVAIEGRLIGQVCAIGSDDQRMAFLQSLERNYESILTLLFQHLGEHPAAVEAGLDLVLRRKAVGAEVLAAQRDAVLGGRYPAVRPQLDELTNLRRRIAQHTLAGPGPDGVQAHLACLAKAQAQMTQLEAELARRLPEMGLEQRLACADHRTVSQALPEGTALVEFVRFNVFNFKAVDSRGEPRWKTPRYAALVLLPAKEQAKVQTIDLGDAHLIDRMIRDFRNGITAEEEKHPGRDMKRKLIDPGTNSSVRYGTPLCALVFTKLIPALDGCKRLLLAPDGELARLPFEVLPTTGGRCLIDDYQISYLSCGRDVLRFRHSVADQVGAALVAADPDFDLHGTGPTSAGSDNQSGRQSRNLTRSDLRFDRIPGTRAEGEIIAGLLGVRPLLGSEVLESRLKACGAPWILHVATHGFFLSNQDRDPKQEHHWVVGGELGRLAGLHLENPLLRSGLALAGSNTWLQKGQLPPEAEDGLLTAEDVSGMDLLDTELVVLSACNTGLGEIRTGEGVFGLRRAFVLAGAKTLVMSLWKVPDEETRELMEDFYRRILAGEPRAEALRNAQLKMKAKYPDPFFWGAFICQGNPGPLRPRRR